MNKTMKNLSDATPQELAAELLSRFPLMISFDPYDPDEYTCIMLGKVTYDDPWYGGCAFNKHVLKIAEVEAPRIHQSRAFSLWTWYDCNSTFLEQLSYGSNPYTLFGDLGGTRAKAIGLVEE